jgi:beta-mannosidase
MSDLIPETSQHLQRGWQLAQVPAGALPAEIAALPAAQWLPATVPGTAHGALLAAGHLKDPSYGTQEAEAQWVGQSTWAWRLQFDCEALATHEDLVFDGLDTYCSAWLNGVPLFSSSNMFVPQRVDVRALLRPNGNDLLLRFDPPLEQARKQEALFGKRHLWNGDSARLYARKAQYHFGWDWGPVLLSSGPWQPVRRHAWAVRIDALECRQQLDLPGQKATLQLQTRVTGLAGLNSALSAELKVAYELLDPEGRCVACASTPAAIGAATLQLESPRLWWPRGLGEAALYTLHTTVVQGEQILASDHRRIGLRTLRLVQAPVAGEAGLSFCFEVNGRDFFTGGANWIPDDNLLERISPARYRERIEQAAQGNMNMLRVWGGGIYEEAAFYEACDELGMLVWQDFMFACGMYPAHAAFQDSVRAEARAAVTRLRHHASLAIWCGNNEDYAIAESIGAHGPKAQPGRFEARAIYEQLLPEVCAELDPDRPYWPGSPYSPNASGITLTTEQSVGDRHSWEVWHQQMLPYQRYHEVQSRFISEFGMQSHASLQLIEASTPVAEQFPQSRTLQWHNKAGSGAPDGHRRLAVYMADNLRVGVTLAEHVYATQFIQAEAMRYAYQDFRRRWQQPGARAVGGALVWQLNDCWPATSWALIDSAGTVKPAWHTIRRALAPLAVALRLEPNIARVAVMNAGSARALRLTLRLFDLSGHCLHRAELAFEADGNSSSERELPLPAFDQAVVGELFATRAGASDTDAPLAVDHAWPEPFRFHRFSSCQTLFQLQGSTLHISSSAPLKGLWLEAAGTDFEDNFIDLMPGTPYAVALRGAPPKVLRWTALDHPTSEAAVHVQAAATDLAPHSLPI